MEYVMIDWREGMRYCNRDRVEFYAEDPDNHEDKIMITSLIRQRMLARIGQVKQPVPGEVFIPVSAVPTAEGADYYVEPDMFVYLRPDFVEIVQECVATVAATQD